MTPEQLTAVRERLDKARKRAVENMSGQADYKGHLWCSRKVQPEPPYLVTLWRVQYGVEHTLDVPLAEIADSLSNTANVELITGRDDIAALLAYVDELEKKVALHEFSDHYDKCFHENCETCRKFVEGETV